MDFSMYVLLGLIALGIIASAGARLAQYFEDRHNERLARIAGMAGRMAGWIKLQISEALAANPAKNVAELKASLLQQATVKMTSEMVDSAKVVGLTPAKAEQMIQGELGKLGDLLPQSTPATTAAG